MAISEQDLPSNWGSFGTSDKIDWFKSHSVTTQELLDAGWIQPSEASWFVSQGLREGSSPAPSIQSSTNSNIRTVEAEPAPTSDYIADLASELELPKFIIANLTNAGYSPDDIRNMYAPAPAPAPAPAASPTLSNTGVASLVNTNTNTGANMAINVAGLQNLLMDLKETKLIGTPTVFKRV